MADLTPDEVMAGHVSLWAGQSPRCSVCHFPWPCDAYQQAQARKIAEARVTALEAVVRDLADSARFGGYTFGSLVFRAVELMEDE